jgi:hypothetical protein
MRKEKEEEEEEEKNDIRVTYHVLHLNKENTGSSSLFFVYLFFSPFPLFM